MAEQLEITLRNAARIIADPKVALAVLTEHRSTFTRRDLARFVNRHTKDAAQFAQVLARIEGAPDLVRLGRDARGEERFNSHGMIATERRLKEHATILAMAKRDRLGASVLRGATTAPELGKEQKEALAHLLGDEGLALLVGFAGSGKSRLLGAARKAWEKAGYRVRGAALAGIAAEGLEAGSGITSRILASWEHAWKQERELLTKGEVLVVDEAGMVGSRQLERVLATARAAQAKVVLVGDPEQLQAIEAGPRSAPCSTGTRPPASIRCGGSGRSGCRRPLVSWRPAARPTRCAAMLVPAWCTPVQPGSWHRRSSRNSGTSTGANGRRGHS